MDKKKKKLSRPVKFMILTGCLLLAVCGYALTLKFSEAAEAEEGGEEIAFVSVSEKDIAKISWTYDGEVYSLERNDDGTWIRPDDEDFAVEQDTADSMLAAAANIGASRKITDVTDYSQYGLDEPQSRIILEYAASEESNEADETEGEAQASEPRTIEILTGDYSDVSGEYYARLAGDDSVYLVSGEYLEYFECTADDLAAADEEEAGEEE